MNINNNHFSSIRQVQETYFQNQPGISRKNSETAASFQEILKQKSEAAGTENKPLKFSRHADAWQIEISALPKNSWTGWSREQKKQMKRESENPLLLWTIYLLL